MESAFTFSFSPIPQLSQYHRPSARSKSLSPYSLKTPQYRVRKCVHEGKPRATNRSRVNPITVQCHVGDCYVTFLIVTSHTGVGRRRWLQLMLRNLRRLESTESNANNGTNFQFCKPDATSRNRWLYAYAVVASRCYTEKFCFRCFTSRLTDFFFRCTFTVRQWRN